MFEIVVNPAGAAGRTLKAWHKAEKVFQQSGEEYHVHFSAITYDIDKICAELTNHAGQIKLVIVGGDGSMNRAVNGIRDFEKVKLGFIPCGSGNDLAKALHISKNPVKCASDIVKNRTKRILDLGQVTYHNIFSPLSRHEEPTFSRLFNISCGIGFDAHICQQVAVSKWKKVFNRLHLGKMIYGIIALKVMAHPDPVPADITLDGKTTHYNGILFTAGMNEPYEGGGFAFCPKADGSDGRLDFCTGDSLSKKDILRIFPYALKGKHVNFKGVYIDTFEKADIQTQKPMWVHQDGEVECMSSHITIEPYRQKLIMLN